MDQDMAQPVPVPREEEKEPGSSSEDSELSLANIFFMSNLFLFCGMLQGYFPGKSFID